MSPTKVIHLLFFFLKIIFRNILFKTMEHSRDMQGNEQRVPLPTVTPYVTAAQYHSQEAGTGTVTERIRFPPVPQRELRA